MMNPNVTRHVQAQVVASTGPLDPDPIEALLHLYHGVHVLRAAHMPDARSLLDRLPYTDRWTLDHIPAYNVDLEGFLSYPGNLYGIAIWTGQNLAVAMCDVSDTGRRELFRKDYLVQITTMSFLEQAAVGVYDRIERLAGRMKGTPIAHVVPDRFFNEVVGMYKTAVLTWMGRMKGQGPNTDPMSVN